MFLRFVPRLGVAAATAMTLVFAAALPTWAQTSSPPASTPAPSKPGAPAQAAPAAPGDAFAEDTTLTAKPIVYVKGTGSWDDAFATISGAFKKLRAYTGKAGLKVDGLPMTIFLSTDDTGFEYEAALPIDQPPKDQPGNGVFVGQSPEGHALKFIHRGSYDDLDNTYEAITNYLDDKRLESKDMFIEEYVTDPATSDENKLTINVFVPIK